MVAVVPLCKDTRAVDAARALATSMTEAVDVTGEESQIREMKYVFELLYLSLIIYTSSSLLVYIA